MSPLAFLFFITVMFPFLISYSSSHSFSVLYSDYSSDCILILQFIPLSLYQSSVSPFHSSSDSLLIPLLNPLSIPPLTPHLIYLLIPLFIPSSDTFLPFQ